MWKRERIEMKTETKIILGCTIILIIFLTFSMMFMLKHIDQLTENPFVYGAKRTSEVNNGSDVICSCYVSGKDEGFSFNQEGLNIQTLKGGDIWNE